MSEKIEVVFLGTGGGVPSLKRFLPATALRRGGDWFLFDAGEGVQNRLRESPLGWGGLKGIFVSHLHGDHVLGLPGLLMTLGMAQRQEPLPIYGPTGLEILVESCLDVCGVRLPFQTPIHAIPRRHARLMEAPGFRVESAPLKHRTTCFGFFFRENERPGRFYPDRAAALGVPAGPLFKSLQSGQAVTLPGGGAVQPEQVLGPPRPGRLIAYCTDTAPCRAVVTYARGADLLIHDSTFGEGLETEARVSGHSTAAQAAAQARAAACRRLALTHLSVRYEDDRPLVQQARAIFPNSFAAADLLVVDVPTTEV